MVDFYEDDKIFDLLDRYGPLGVTVYDCILCIVYRHGYYAEIPLDKLSKMVTKMIGNKWVKSSKAVVQVVHFCSEIGLINDDLMTKNIITSVGIQKRFYRIAVKLMKRQLYDEDYWLLKKEETEEPFLNAPKNQLSSEENPITSEINTFNYGKSTIKEKETKRKDIETDFPVNYFVDPILNNQFLIFLKMREQQMKTAGEILTANDIQLYRESLESLADKTEERTAIVKQALMNHWKNFYPPKKKRESTTKPKNRFNNFSQRDNAEIIKHLEARNIGADYKQ